MIYQCKYFKLQELVSPLVFNRYGEFAWAFFDENILRDLDLIRQNFGSGIVINSWLFGGSTTQCGFRSNMDKMVKDKKNLYCSPHTMGKAFDLHGFDNVKLFNLIKQMIKTDELKAIKRLETRSNTHDNWVHADSFQTDKIVFS
ncbi:MAG: hypothetical protein K6C94_08985 [Candidatus Gastranaerophilales bacterium]|nr:hypothetical protein [Candidatus Gastranaerophilales bacterium]